MRLPGQANFSSCPGPPFQVPSCRIRHRSYGALWQKVKRRETIFQHQKNYLMASVANDLPVPPPPPTPQSTPAPPDPSSSFFNFGGPGWFGDVFNVSVRITPIHTSISSLHPSPNRCRLSSTMRRMCTTTASASPSPNIRTRAPPPCMRPQGL